MKTRTIRRWATAALLSTAATALAGGAAAAVPSTMTHQGRLYDATKQPVSATLDVTFAVYDALAATIPIWSESHSVVFDQGYFSVALGSVVPFVPSVFDGSTRYLGITVGTDPEMKPRVAILSVPYASMAGDVNGNIHPTSVSIAGVGTIIDGTGKWVGSATGLAGATGPQGATGPDGVTGPQGATGPGGAPGPTGPTGPSGVDGMVGPQGPAGGAGPIGAQGLPGATGPTGPAGADGANGANGAPGSANINGTPNYIVKFTSAVGGANSQIFDDGTNVGIATASPAERLEVSGNIHASGTVYWGNGNTRTESRDDAGTQGGKSGWYETPAPTNYYPGSSSWQHMVETRHSNGANNYAMQIAGSFFDEDLWYRKTNNSPTTEWLQIVASGPRQCTAPFNSVGVTNTSTLAGITRSNTICATARIGAANFDDAQTFCAGFGSHVSTYNELYRLALANGAGPILVVGDWVGNRTTDDGTLYINATAVGNFEGPAMKSDVRPYRCVRNPTYNP